MPLLSRVTRRSAAGRRSRMAAPLVVSGAILAVVAGTATTAAGRDTTPPPGTATAAAGTTGIRSAAPVDAVPNGIASTGSGPNGSAPNGSARTGGALNAAGQIADPAPTAGGLDALEALGVKPFLYPSASPFCNDGSTLGLVPAYAGAVPGPWPKTNVTLPGLDLAAVKSGQTMFAFVPYGVDPDGTDTSGMRVIWWNADTHRAGSATMGTLSDVLGTMVPPQVPPALRPLAEQVVQGVFGQALPVGGIRAVPVETGSGTVLAAVFGSIRNGNRTCWFLPTVGITEVP
ncbi:hypothetical protein [Nocardia aurantia]|uniref:Uncharacterized protein n=1 Tax=Nocardia aurantia TaxID=2585199 RepID=A0A7K0DIQ6_9NOCA|nr:hypothetical protein [Nocardia aurantia]MQY25579.1 hypothetical protein [Nocardia aurantia]